MPTPNPSLRGVSSFGFTGTLWFPMLTGFGVVYHPNGVIYDQWLPVGSGADFKLSPTLAGLEPFRIARRGIARTFQNIRLFADMTVLQNVMQPLVYRTMPRAEREQRAARDQASGT